MDDVDDSHDYLMLSNRGNVVRGTFRYSLRYREEGENHARNGRVFTPNYDVSCMLAAHAHMLLRFFMTAGDFGVFLLRLLIIEYARDTVDLTSIMYSQTRAYFNLHTLRCVVTLIPQKLKSKMKPGAFKGSIALAKEIGSKVHRRRLMGLIRLTGMKVDGTWKSPASRISIQSDHSGSEPPTFEI